MNWLERALARVSGGRPGRARVLGINYVPVGPTSVLHDSEAARLADEIGFFEQPAEGESIEDFVRRHTLKINSSGKIVDLLGYYLIPEGTPPGEWSLEMARETSRRLGSVSDPGDRAKVEKWLGEAVVYFFALARASWPGTPSSSNSATRLVTLAAQLLPDRPLTAAGVSGRP